MEFMENKLLPIAGKLAEIKWLRAIRDGLIATIPILIAGSVFMILRNIPDMVSAVAGAESGAATSINELFGPFMPHLKQMIVATFNTMSIYTAFAIGYAYAGELKIDQLTTGLISMIALLAAVPFLDGWSFLHEIANGTGLTADVAGEAVTGFGAIGALWADFKPIWFLADMDNGYGGPNMFLAILIGFMTAGVYNLFIKNNIAIKLPEGVPPAVSRSFSALLPAIAVFAIIFVLNFITWNYFETDLTKVINTALQKPFGFLTGNIFGTTASVFLVTLFWCFGLHGANIINPILTPTFMAFLQENIDAKVAGTALPNVANQTFVDVFVWVGGSGGTLALAFMIAFLAKSKQLKTLGKTALPASIFNINEPLIFGLPIVMNPVLWAPFVLAPTLNCIISYLAMDLGLVEKVSTMVHWTMPVGLSGFLATGDFMAVALQVVTFAVSFVFFFPFFKVYDKQKVAEENSVA